MKHSLRLVVGAAALIAALIAADSLNAQSAGVRNPGIWQYKVLDVFAVQDLGKAAEHRLEGGLDKLGAEGWELVAVEPGVPRPSSVTANDKNSSSPLYYARPPQFYFKRSAAK